MKTSLLQIGFLFSTLAGGAALGDDFATGSPSDYIEGKLENIRVENRALILTDTHADFKPVYVTAGKAYQLSFAADFAGDVESIEDNPRFDLFTQPSEVTPRLPSRQIEFLDEGGKPVGRKLLSAMPFRERRDYIDLFHAPPTAVSMKLKITSGTGLSLTLRDMKVEEFRTASDALNINPTFALGSFNYSGWQNISAGGKLVERDGKTVFDTKYGSRGREFPLAGPGTYALSAKATGNGYNATAHVDIFDNAGKKLMRASVRHFGETNYFVVPPGATSASLLVYSCLLEEIRVKRVGDEGAIEAFR